VTALLALALAAAPGCPPALAEAEALAAAELGRRAPAIVERLARAGAGGPVAALERLAQDADPEPFRAGLARHCALAAAAAAPRATDAERAELAAILARLERSRPDPGALRRALLAARAWLLELLGTAEAERYASLGRALFLAVAAGAAALGWIALRRRRGLPAHAEPPAPAEATGPALPDGSAARAEDALRRGDGRAAIRHAFLAALGALEREGRVPRGRALTNAELVAALTARSAHPERRVAAGDARSNAGAPEPPPLAADFAALAAAFDRAIYAALPVGIDEARAAVARARRVAS
jgi:hypothetical protein